MVKYSWPWVTTRYEHAHASVGMAPVPKGPLDLC
jgi:hypothetical protein